MKLLRRRAFTLVELMVVLAIMGVLSVLLAPTLASYRKDEAMTAATRQVLDDAGRARQMAISERTTVYMVFVPTNFWKQPGWVSVPASIRNSMTVTQLYAAQWSGYAMFSLRGVGDQPGETFARDLMRVKTLPTGTFFSPLKFPGGPQSAPQYQYGSGTSVAPLKIGNDIEVYSFLTTTSVPFPTSDMLATSSPAGFVDLPYIAFNYLGQLVGPDGKVLPYDENIPLARGTISYWRDSTTGLPVQPAVGKPAIADVTEIPAGNDISTSYNVIHVDRLTGRARLERQDAL
jgi:prepilin-type N-terminal cleavage/methylation domain-containing protein